MQIIKNVPIPPLHKTFELRSELALLIKKMEPGDSMVFETISKLHSAWNYMRKFGFKSTYRTISHEPKKWQIWRIA